MSSCSPSPVPHPGACFLSCSWLPPAAPRPPWNGLNRLSLREHGGLSLGLLHSQCPLDHLGLWRENADSSWGLRTSISRGPLSGEVGVGEAGPGRGGQTVGGVTTQSSRVIEGLTCTEYNTDIWVSEQNGNANFWTFRSTSRNTRFIRSASPGGLFTLSIFPMGARHTQSKPQALSTSNTVLRRPRPRSWRTSERRCWLGPSTFTREAKAAPHWKRRRGCG